MSAFNYITTNDPNLLPSSVARVKGCPVSEVSDAIQRGDLSVDENNRIVWDDRYEGWSPNTPPIDLCFSINEHAPDIKTMILMDRNDAIRWARRRSFAAVEMREEAEDLHLSADSFPGGAEWDLVPMRTSALHIYLLSQSGTLDGNVYCSDLYFEALERLICDQSVYQLRISIPRSVFLPHGKGSGHIKPSAPLLHAPEVARELGVPMSDIHRAILVGDIFASFYGVEWFVRADKYLRAWARNRSDLPDLISEQRLRR